MRHTTTSRRGGCAVCGTPVGGPWATCSEVCTFLRDAEEAMAAEAVHTELAEKAASR